MIRRFNSLDEKNDFETRLMDLCDFFTHTRVGLYEKSVVEARKRKNSFVYDTRLSRKYLDGHRNSQVVV